MDDLEKILARIEELGTDARGYRFETYLAIVCVQSLEIEKIKRVKLPAEVVNRARQELQEIYENSPWYYARYRAGAELNLPEGWFGRNLENWVLQLLKDLNAVLPDHYIKPPRPKEPSFFPHHDPDSGEYYGTPGCQECARRIEEFSQKYDRWRTEVTEWKRTEPSILIKDAPDEETRKRARIDLEKLYPIANTRERRQDIAIALGIEQSQFLSDEILKGSKLPHQELLSIYLSKQAETRARERAGRELGYSNLKVWTYVHPIQATITGIAVIGAGFGIGQMIYSYLSK